MWLWLISLNYGTNSHKHLKQSCWRGGRINSTVLTTQGVQMAKWVILLVHGDCCRTWSSACSVQRVASCPSTSLRTCSCVVFTPRSFNIFIGLFSYTFCQPMYGEHQLLPVPTHAPNLQHYSTNLSWGTKIRIYKTITQPVLMYGSELGTLSEVSS